ncbi:MAG: hypothetical protein JXN59_09845 [Anaerolineae bacterium]|nr:hypothetical protein [Anaerolineae bacterium]
MRRFSLDDIYTDPGAASIRGYETEHRQRVEGALFRGEPVYLYWWDRDISGLVLFTDRRIVQFPRYRKPTGLFGFSCHFDTWSYPYQEITVIDCDGGSLLELPRIILQRRTESDILIVFNRAKRDQLLQFANILRTLHAFWLDKHPQDQTELPTLTDHAMRLRELYNLYQNGLLDEDAYHRAKARLIAE